ncbi:hypothetical protein, partial [Aeromonas caviae]|nr:hypothetical protein [Aeromonas caviae]
SSRRGNKIPFRRRIDSSKPTCRQNRCCKNGSDHRFRFLRRPHQENGFADFLVWGCSVWKTQRRGSLSGKMINGKLPPKIHSVSGGGHFFFDGQEIKEWLALKND